MAATDTYGLYNTDMCEHRACGSGISRSGASGSYTYSVASDLREPPGELRELLGRLPVRQLAAQRPADRRAGRGHDGDGAYTLDGYNGNDGRTIQRNPGSKWAVTSEDEWYKAAYYKGGSTNAGYWDYPTSSDTAPGRDMTDASGNNANYYTGTGPYPIDSPYYTTVVGEFQNSASPYGTFDQGGNVWEWNEAVSIRFGIAACGAGRSAATTIPCARRCAASASVTMRGLQHRVPCCRGS